MSKKNNRKGFTIVELVIVIAVIAILATVLVPTFSGIVEKANKSALTQELRNAYTSYVIVAAEDGEFDENVIIKHDNKFYIVKSGNPDTTAYNDANAAAIAMGVADGEGYTLYDSSVATPVATATAGSN